MHFTFGRKTIAKHMHTHTNSHRDKTQIILRLQSALELKHSQRPFLSLWCAQSCVFHMYLWNPFEMPPAQRVQSLVHTHARPDGKYAFYSLKWKRTLGPLSKTHKHTKSTSRLCTNTHLLTHTHSFMHSERKSARHHVLRPSVRLKCSYCSGNTASNLHKHTPSFPHSWYSHVIIAGRLKAC